MKYNLSRISKMSDKIDTYEIYISHGSGTVESPIEEGRTLEILHCSEIDAWIISESKNIILWGLIHNRTSWESPRVTYRKLIKKNNRYEKE